jgi:hypothetical protein
MMGLTLNQLFKTPVEPVVGGEIGPELHAAPDLLLCLAMFVWFGIGLLLFGLGWSCLEVLGVALAAYCASDDPWDRE